MRSSRSASGHARLGCSLRGPRQERSHIDEQTKVAEARRKVAEAGLDPAIVDEAVEAARRSA